VRKGPSIWQCEGRTLYLAVRPGDVLFHVVLKKDDEEGRDQVVDSLHVSAGRMSDGPDVQDAFNHFLFVGLVVENRKKKSQMNTIKLQNHNQRGYKTKKA
jgi:hypothetical protein